MVEKDAARQESAWQKRQALQIVAMLPDDSDEALAVLGYARRFVHDFLARQDDADVVRLVTEAGAAIERP